MNTDMSLFVTGTDTDVGKTVVTAALLSLMRAEGTDAVPMKPVQTGCATSADGLDTPDLSFCLRSVGLSVTEAEREPMCPFRFQPACSPHLAASLAGEEMPFETIKRHIDTLRDSHDAVIVEGAGGVLVPMGGGRSMLDLMAFLGIPVVLASRPGLGTLNHTLLSLRELRRADIDVAGVVFCETAPTEWGTIENDNRRTIEQIGGVPVLGIVPFIPGLADGDISPGHFHEIVSASLRLPTKQAPPTLDMAARVWELDRQSVWHPFTRHSAMEGDPFPVISRGKGVHLFDADGRRYVDAISSWWACNLGHSHPRLVEAIKRQAERLQHSILGNLSHANAAELAAEIAGLFPDEGRRILFASDGACAVEAALRVAIQYWHNIGRPERRRFVALREGYHGDTLGAMSLGYMPSFHAAYEHVVSPVFHADAPCCAGCARGCEPATCDVDCFSSMHSIVDTHSAEIAAVVVEPLCQGAAGMRMYSPRYLQELRRLCDTHGILLILDEIAVGMGRTGRMFAFEHAGVVPDMVCLGKGLAGGYLPISVAVVGQKLHATFADTPVDHTLYHGHTFAGNPIATAAALECLRIYRDDGIVGRAQRMGRVLADEMQVFHDTPGTTNLRCLGMIGAVELLDRDGEAGVARAQRVRQALLAKGILLRPLGNVLYLMLPLVTPEDVLRQTVADFHEAIARA